jgi:hypothetical protein
VRPPPVLPPLRCGLAFTVTILGIDQRRIRLYTFLDRLLSPTPPSGVGTITSRGIRIVWHKRGVVG